MDIKHLNTFITVHNLNGFTKAGIHLGYAQSTITSHIKAIEEEIGSPVFDRIGKNIILTDAGLKILPEAVKITEIYRNIKETTRSDQIVGTIKISAPEVFLLYRFPNILKSFIKKHPLVKFEIKHDDQRLTTEKLLEGKTDIAFTIDQQVNSNEIIANTLFLEEMVFLCSKDVKNMSIKQLLESQTVFLTEEGCSYRNVFNKLMKHYNINTDKVIEIESIEMIKKLLIQKIGVTILPYQAVKEEIEEGQIHATKIPTDIILYTQVLYHKDKWKTPAITSFLDYINSFIVEERMSKI